MTNWIHAYIDTIRRELKEMDDVRSTDFIARLQSVGIEAIVGEYRIDLIFSDGTMYSVTASDYDGLVFLDKNLDKEGG